MTAPGTDAPGGSAKYEEDVRDGCGMGCGCERDERLEEGFREVSEVTDGTRIGVELTLPAGVRARPAFAPPPHGKEPEFACANALSELVEYVRALEDKPTVPPGVAAPPVNGPATAISNPRPILLRLMKGRFAMEEGSKSGIRDGNEVGLDGGGDADLEVEVEVEGCEEKEMAGVVAVELADADADVEGICGERVVVRVGLGVGLACGSLLVGEVAILLELVASLLVTNAAGFDLVKLDAILLRRRKAAVAAASRAGTPVVDS